jgi:2-furoyl-CoA dehydrogenase FAD binding subunit
MKPAAFDYVRADTADDAAALLARHGEDARILAGGQSLMAILNMRLAQPSVLVDISRSREMAGIAREGSQLRVGASATQAQLEAHADLPPLLALAFPHISHFQIRNRGTVCGSIAHADPSAELPLCLLALQGVVHLRSAQQRRSVPAADFFTGLFSTARAPDELVEAVSFPLPRAGEGCGFAEFSRRHGDYAVCAVAAVVCAGSLRLAAAGVADRPVALDLPMLAADELDAAINDWAWSLPLRDDPHTTAATRRHLLRRLGPQAVAQAIANARRTR